MKAILIVMLWAIAPLGSACTRTVYVEVTPTPTATPSATASPSSTPTPTPSATPSASVTAAPAAPAAPAAAAPFTPAATAAPVATATPPTAPAVPQVLIAGKRITPGSIFGLFTYCVTVSVGGASGDRCIESSGGAPAQVCYASLQIGAVAPDCWRTYWGR